MSLSCQACGAQLSAGSTFCAACGADVRYAGQGGGVPKASGITPTHFALAVGALVIAIIVGFWMLRPETPPPPAAAPAVAQPPAAPVAAAPAARPTSAITPGQTVAPFNCTVADYSGSPLNIRNAPNGNILGALYNGTSVSVIAISNARNGQRWFRVISQEGKAREGWVSSRYLDCR